MKDPKAWTALALAAMAAGGMMTLLACANQAATRTSSRALRPASTPSLQDRIAHGLAAASPPADPASVQARDAAADKLARLTDLLISAPSEILWGGFEEKKGYEPAAYRLTALTPLVWAKVYLSTFMFSGAYEVRREGRFTVLAAAAKFRDGLDAGDYPYPFWHSAQKWQAYVDTTAVLLVFEENRLIAAYRQAELGPRPAAVKHWDGRWRWQDTQDRAQPRVALYSYLLSSANPYAASLEAAYRSLAGSFRDQSCFSCHGPDNRAQADKLFLLNFPNQALAARHTLAAMLRGDKMPPPDAKTGSAGGIPNARVRGELIRLAEVFEREADRALAFEREHRGTGD